MLGHAILFIVLPLAVAWLAGASVTFRPIPPRRPNRRSSLGSRQRSGCSWPSTVNLTLRPTGTRCRVRANAPMDGAASAARLVAMICHPAPSLEPIRGMI